MGTPNGSQGPSSMATTQAESATDDSGDRRQLELLLRHFGHSVHVASGRNVDNQQDSADSPGVESNSVNIPITTLNQIEQQAGHDFQSEPSRVLDLTAAFSHLSTLNTPVPLVPRVPPGFPPYSVTFQPSRSAKYYVISVSPSTSQVLVTSPSRLFNKRLHFTWMLNVVGKLNISVTQEMLRGLVQTRTLFSRVILCSFDPWQIEIVEVVV